MSEQFTILIADRNRHIREFLQRELAAEGYRTKLTNDGREVLRMLSEEPPDLLILDLEMPYIDGNKILEHLHGGTQPVPVIVHSFSFNEPPETNKHYGVTFVEKNGKNIEGLKRVVANVLEASYPDRFSSGNGGVLPEAL